MFDAAPIESLPPQARTTVHPRTMISQSNLDPTQELSPSHWELHLSRTRSVVNPTSAETQHTLNEGDDGHIDIMSSFVQAEEDKELEIEDNRAFSPSQSQRRLSQFPESQRFKTPAAAGKKRDYNGNTRDSPELPRAPVLRSGGAPMPAHLMGMSQVFDATQAATSPFVNAGINPLSDRPSPNLELDYRPATATVSSPLRPISAFRRATTEPATRYISVAQSQEERDRKAQLKLLDEDDESDYDDFNDEPSMVKRQRRRREFEARANEQFRQVSSPSKARPPGRGSSAVKSSPVLAAQRSSPSPPPALRLSGSRILFNQDPVLDDEEDVEPSEAETEQEEEIDVEIRRSSQTSPMDEADKENYPANIQIPETTARMHHVVDMLPSQVEASPSLRHGVATTRITRRSAQNSDPVAVANSQPSQPALKSQTSRQNPKSSSTSVIDFVPQSQGPAGQHSVSAGPTQTPPASPQPKRAKSKGLTEITQDEGKEQIDQDVLVEPVAPEQASAPANLGNTVPETDSSRIIQSHQPSRSTNSAPGANTLPTNEFETAATRLPPASDARSNFSNLSSQPIVITPPGQKRKRMTMTAISANPSPQQQSTQGFNPEDALQIGSDVQPFLDESPIRPTARQAKRRKLQKEEVEIAETASRRFTRSLQQSHAASDRDSPKPAEDAEIRPAPQSHPAVDAPDLRNSTRTRASVWELEVSPQQKRVPTRAMSRQSATPVVIAEEALKKKLPASTAPEKRVSTKKQNGIAAQAQTQAEVSAEGLSQPPSHISKPQPGEIIAPNVVFACFNGKTRAYYPARCLGATDGEPARYRVQWEGCDPDEVDAHGIRSLDLRVGDQVKVDMPGFPKVSHIIRGFGEDASEAGDDLTDIRGHTKLLVAPKQRKSLPADVSTESIREVPVSAIYLDSNMWNQMKDRSFEFKPPQDVSICLSGYATPMERASTPSTPSSRNRRQAAAQLALGDAPPSGMFANMAFAISYKEENRKTTLENLVRENGGRLLQGSFMELLEPDTTAPKSQYTNTGFTALIADKTLKESEVHASTCPWAAMSQWEVDRSLW